MVVGQVLGVGAVERWWGPGWNNGLILSNNARPSAGLLVQRVQTHFHHLRIFGPWTISGLSLN